MFAVTYLGGELKSLLGLEEGLATLVQGEEQVRPVLRIRFFFLRILMRPKRSGTEPDVLNRVRCLF
jgi:hypothetical protein